MDLASIGLESKKWKEVAYHQAGKVNYSENSSDE